MSKEYDIPRPRRTGRVDLKGWDWGMMYALFGIAEVFSRAATDVLKIGFGYRDYRGPWMESTLPSSRGAGMQVQFTLPAFGKSEEDCPTWTTSMYVLTVGRFRNRPDLLEECGTHTVRELRGYADAIEKIGRQMHPEWDKWMEEGT